MFVVGKRRYKAIKFIAFIVHDKVCGNKLTRSEERKSLSLRWKEAVNRKRLECNDKLCFLHNGDRRAKSTYHAKRATHSTGQTFIVRLEYSGRGSAQTLSIFHQICSGTDSAMLSNSACLSPCSSPSRRARTCYVCERPS